MADLQQERQKRQIAFTLPIEDILTGEYVVMDGWNPNYVKLAWGLKVSRINVIGTVVSVDQNSIEIDDTTGILPVRTFERFPAFDAVKPGMLVMIIGKIRQFNNELYVLPESLVAATPHMLAYRKIEWEILKKYFREDRIVQELDQMAVSLTNDSPTPVASAAEKPAETLADKVLSYIEEKDSGSGVHRQEILMHFEDPKVGSVFDKLINDGDVFEIEPDIFKVLK